MTPKFSCRWELRDPGHVSERSSCSVSGFVSGVEVTSLPVPHLRSTLELGVQPVLGNPAGFFHLTAQNPLVGAKTILYGMIVSQCSKGGILESQKLITMQTRTEGISQAAHLIWCSAYG